MDRDWLALGLQSSCLLDYLTPFQDKLAFVILPFDLAAFSSLAQDNFYEAKIGAEEGSQTRSAHPVCPSKAKTGENNLKKLYDLCIPKDLRNHNLLITIALEMDRLGSYLLRRNSLTFSL